MGKNKGEMKYHTLKELLKNDILACLLYTSDLELVDEAADCGFGNLSVYDETIIFELSVNGCRRHAWIIRFKIPDPFLQFIIKFTAHTCIRASFRDKGIKPVVLIIQIPFFDG